MAQVTEQFKPQPEYLAAERAVVDSLRTDGLRQHAAGLIAKSRQKSRQKEARTWAWPLAIYGGLALAVMLPLLAPGYILTLDMAFTPELRMPEDVSSSYLFHAALHYLNFVLPGDIIQKIMLLVTLMLSGLGMHFLVRHIQASKNPTGQFALWGAYIAGAIYMINPFTYSRFMAGQYAVLLGYALLPFFARAVLNFLAVPTLKRALIMSGWAIAIGIVSVHTLGLEAILTVAALAVYAWRFRQNSNIALATFRYGVVGLAVFAMASGYWLLPLLGGESNQGQAITQFSVSDQQAFQTTGNSWIDQLGNVLQLQGFWAEGRGHYLLPQDVLPGWPVVIVGFWVLVGIGFRWLWRQHRTVAIVFAVAGAAATVLAINGAGSFSALAGFREPHKFIGLLALAFALFAGLGAANLLAWAKRRNGITFGILGVTILLVPVLYTPTMFWGFASQLSPRHYPADWHDANQLLNRDKTDFRVLSLPWHLYMHYPFAERIIVNPSEHFFDKPTIASNELEFKNASPTFPDADKKILSDDIIPNAPTNSHLAEELSHMDIRYVLLAKTFDYQNYAYLDKQPGFELISETANLKVYRNLAHE